MTRDIANPMAPRLRLVQIASAALPSCTVSQNLLATSAGPGSAYEGLMCAMYASCHTPTSRARNTIGGSTDRTKIRPGPGAGGRSGPVSSASRPASTARFSAASLRSTRLSPRSLAMATDLLVQLAGDLRGEGTDAGRLDRARLRDVDLPLADDT